MTGSAVPSRPQNQKGSRQKPDGLDCRVVMEGRNAGWTPQGKAEPEARKGRRSSSLVLRRNAAALHRIPFINPRIPVGRPTGILHVYREFFGSACLSVFRQNNLPWTENSCSARPGARRWQPEADGRGAMGEKPGRFSFVAVL